jgi:hypothetical protein
MNPLTLLTTLALAALSTSTAIETPHPYHTPPAPLLSRSFTWSSWVDSLITDPSHALSPEEALAAFNNANTDTDSNTSDAIKRQQLANCQQLSSRSPSTSDAVACINDLAARGKAGQKCNVDGYQARVQCRLGSADVVTVRGRDDAPKSVNW